MSGPAQTPADAIAAFDDDYSDWKGWAAQPFGTPDAYLHDYYDREILARRAGANIRLMDIGFGSGSLLAWGRDRGLAVEGVEVNPGLRAAAREAGFLVHDSVEDTVGDEAFDVITAMDVLEHLETARALEMLAQVRRRLKPGGLFIARFPNGDSPFSLYYQNGDVTHVAALGRGKIEYYSRRAGLTLDYLGPPARIRPKTLAEAVRQRLGELGRAALERLVGRLYFGGRTIPFSVNAVAVLSKPVIATGKTG